MRPRDTDALFRKAVEHHKHGRLREALSLYDALIGLNSSIAPAHYNRGIALQSLNRFDEALQSYDRAIMLQPNYTEAHYNSGVTLSSLNRLEDAVRSYDKVIALKPHHADAYYGRGNALRHLNRFEEAVRSFDRAIQIRPDHVDAYNNRGNTLKELKRLEDALRDFDRAIGLKPDFAEAHNNRGSALKLLKRFPEALQSFNRAIALRPDFAGAHTGRGDINKEIGNLEEALDDYDRAIALRPDYADAYNNKGNALLELKRPDEALQCYDRALELKPDHPEAHSNRGHRLRLLKRLEQAVECYDKAITFKPDFVEAYWDKATSMLLMGNLEQGLSLYEWRKKRAEPAGFRMFPQPEWTGKERLEGRTLFVHAEQGLGDTIQFCRYARIAREKGAKVVFAVQDPLMRLLESLGPEIDLIPLTGVPDTFDCHIAMMSLPLALGTTLETCPATVPYLHAEPEKVAKWRARIGSEGFRIGICWQGNKQAEVDAGRSFPLRHFENLAKIPNVRLISLQKNDGVEQLADLPPGMTVETLGDDFDAGPDAFVDTAAAMECLDLVITSDTAVAHLAGALGRPAWIALKYVPDWRWLLDRRDSPWYPTMRLFRQQAPGDWHSIFAAIETELADPLYRPLK